MRIQYMTCPRCGGEIQAADVNRISYCSYCGAPLFVDDDTVRTTVIRDEARLKEAENEARRLDLEEQKLRYERERFEASLPEKQKAETAGYGRYGTAAQAPGSAGFIRVFFSFIGIIFLVVCALGYVVSPIDVLSGIVLDDLFVVYLCVKAIRRILRRLERN